MSVWWAAIPVGLGATIGVGVLVRRYGRRAVRWVVAGNLALLVAALGVLVLAVLGRPAPADADQPAPPVAAAATGADRVPEHRRAGDRSGRRTGEPVDRSRRASADRRGDRGRRLVTRCGDRGGVHRCGGAGGRSASGPSCSAGRWSSSGWPKASRSTG